MKKNQALIITGNLVYLAAQWALSVIVVRLSDDYYMAGLLGLALTITNVFYIIACYGMRSFQVSDVQRIFSDQCYMLSRVITVTIALIVCLFYSMLKGYNADAFGAISIYMIYKCFEAVSDVLYGIFQMNDCYGKLCVSMCVKGIGSAAVFTILLAARGSIILGLIGMCVVALITCVFLDLRWAKKMVDPLITFSKSDLKDTFRLLSVSFPMLILLIAQPLLMSIPRLYFEQNYSVEQLGIYSSLSSPTMVITTFVSCAMMPYVPLFARYYYEENHKGLYKLTFGSVILAACFGLLAYLVGGWIGEWGLALLYGSSISGYINVFKLIIIVSTLSSITMCLNALFTAIRKLISLSVVLMMGCVLCYLITPQIIDAYQMSGVTYALMVAQLFQIVLACILAVVFIHNIRITDINKSTEVRTGSL